MPKLPQPMRSKLASQPANEEPALFVNIFFLEICPYIFFENLSIYFATNFATNFANNRLDSNKSSHTLCGCIHPQCHCLCFITPSIPKSNCLSPPKLINGKAHNILGRELPTALRHQNFNRIESRAKYIS